MKNIWKNISGLAPLVTAAAVAVAAVGSLSNYTAPVYGAENTEDTEMTDGDEGLELLADSEAVTEAETESTETMVIAKGAFDLEDGTYEGSAKGFSGKVKVAVVIKNKTIQAINILSNSDDAAFFNRAKDGVVAEILAKQSTDVDTVSGATYSSKGIINAVKNALSVDEGDTDTVIAKGNFALEDGYYEGTGTGFAGPIRLFIEIEDKSIVGIYIVKTSDDAGFFNRAKEGVTASILEKQSTDVDTVSGATYSSKGIIEAVKNALNGDTEEAYTIGKGDFNIADGTYEGSAQGYSDIVTVSVKVENRTITSINIVSQSDTASYFERAKGVIKTILADQTLNVDAVSGATFSSNGIINAVKNALGLDKEEDPKIGKGNFKIKDGTYSGTGTGYRGDINLSITVKDKTIEKIDILKYSDDEAYFNRAKSGVVPSILKKQSTEVDTVSGATFSSKGIIEAVNNALKTGTGEAETETETKKGKFDYPDGIYEGVGEGYGGDIRVMMVLQDKTIKAILITEHKNEDDTFFSKAKTVADTIVKKQSVKVDTVSGATYSSKGIIEAVSNAIEAAKKAKNGENSEQPDTEQPDTETPDNGTETSYYGVVICSPDADKAFDAYNLHVKVTLKGGKITAVSDVYGDGDSGNNRFITKAVEGSEKNPGVAKQIVSKNGINGVDTISGATCTSKALLHATEVVLNAAAKDGLYNAGGQENGGGDTENGGGSTENGDGSTENGGGNTENGGGSTENGGGSTENGGGSTENGGGSTENGGGSTESGGSTETTSVYNDGEYKVSVICSPDEYEDFDAYNLSLTVIIKNDKITEIKDISGDGGKGNESYIRLASKGVVDQILKKNSAEGIDAVSFATCSSNAIIEACRQALEQAKKQ